MSKAAVAALLFTFFLTACSEKTEAPKVVSAPPAASEPVAATTAVLPVNPATGATPSNDVVTNLEFPQAFEIAGGRSLKGYQGIDPFKFLTMYTSKLRIEKGEFETTADFLKRKSNTDSRLAPISSKALYAFQLGNFFVKYDVDNKSYVIDYRCNVPYDQPLIICLLKIGDTQDAKYMAQNGYGTRVEVNQTSAIFMNLAIKDKNPLFKSSPKWASDVRSMDLKLPVSIESAQAMRGHKLSMLVIGHVAGTGVSTAGSTYKAPTREDPRELAFSHSAIPFTLKKAIFYNETTGEILVEKTY